MLVSPPTTLEAALAIIAEQAKTIERLTKRIDALDAENARLRTLLSPDPSTPSGMTPTYQKANLSRGRRQKPGRPRGHQGCRRPPPEQIDEHREHSLSHCPDCGTRLGQSVAQRQRYTEELPPARPTVTAHTIHRYWCPRCQKGVEPKVAEALPGCTLGLNLLLTTAWLHYRLGVSAGHVVRWLSIICRLKVSKGGLLQAWAKLAELLEPMYQEIGQAARASAVLHADETGWRLSGCTWWLWCFCNRDLAYYVIARCRGSPVVKQVLGEIFQGVLVTDFYAAYNRLCAWAKQRCVVHLLRELKKVAERNRGSEWRAFHKQLKRLLRDGLRLRARVERMDEVEYARRCGRLVRRMLALAAHEYLDADCRRLAARLRRHRAEIFTFLAVNGVTADNNLVERELRFAVQARKNYFGNRSARGAETQAILMTVLRTLELRGHEPVSYLREAIQSALLEPKTLPLAA